MVEEKNITKEKKVKDVKPVVVSTTSVAGTDVKKKSTTTNQQRFFTQKKRQNFRRKPRVAPEFKQKTLNIRRVARVMAGGRRFSFSVALAIGDEKGRIGVGLGKAKDTAMAIQKAFSNAKKNMVYLKLNETSSIDYEVSAKYCSAKVALRPNHGRGLVAGSAVRILLELAGIKDITGKIRSRSKDKLNIARATIKALSDFTGAMPVKKVIVKGSDNFKKEDKTNVVRNNK